MDYNGVYMSLIDWLILVIPVCFVIFMGFFSRRYVRGVSDFLACGRLCGRYVISMGDLAQALSIIGLVAYVEVKYKTGFALSYWWKILAPMTIMISLFGYCTYRFRETRAMSLGQFLEIRYSRKMRVFGASLRSFAEMLANMIMPAIAARFFIQMLNLPQKFTVLGLTIPTFEFLMILFLTLAILLICLGGTLALVITDTIQGMLLYPLIFIFVIFILWKFSWSKEIIPVVTDRIQGESFINPYDISKLRDFNVFTGVVVGAFNSLFHTATWIGAGSSTSAKSAHEQKMASILGSWRILIVNLFSLLIAICLITFLNHKDFANESNAVRQQLAMRISEDAIKDETTRAKVQETIRNIQPVEHQIGIDPPLSQNDNMDTKFLAHIHQTLKEDARERTIQELAAENGGVPLTEEQLKDSDIQTKLIYAEGQANDTFQQCRTLFNQLSLSVTMKAVLPVGLFGCFCLLLFLAMLSTDDTRIFSASLTISQDVILPFFSKGLTPRQHVWMIRLVSIGVGVFFFFGSKFMAQLDYVQLFTTMAVAIWNAGCPAVMIFGLYWKRGTTAAAWSALIAGIIGSVGYILLQRNWADVVYPFLADNNLVDMVDTFLKAISSPFGDWIKWEIDPVRFPVNAIEYLFFANIFTILLYIVVSLITCRKPFNMDRMLHRGKYSDSGSEPVRKFDWSPKNILKSLIGITPEYTRGDKAIAYGMFFYSFVYEVVICFICVAIWNAFSPWPIEYWSKYFFVVSLLVPLLITGFTAVWFGIGGTVGLFQLFRDLERRKSSNVLDDGRVSGNINLADIANVEKVESEEKKEKKE